jgi:signal transduction histidine kinase/sugar phosphate isomerase/epimerase
MKIGFGTVLWGRRIDDLDYMLRVVSACGYTGVEFAQHHSQIFVRREGGKGVRSIDGIAELRDRLEVHGGLELLGLVSGTLDERVQFLAGDTGPYLYLDRFPPFDEIERALKGGHTLALHPHWLMPLRRQKQALEWIKKYADTPYRDQIRLLLDTGHAVIAEEDPVEIARSHHRKLAAVHSKSWRPDYGRWSHRYAHGFCSPGLGIVPVEEVMQALFEKEYSGWVIAEQDHYHLSRETTALECACWLADHGHKWGVKIRPDKALIDTIVKEGKPNPLYEPLVNSGGSIEQWVIDQINGGGKVPGLFDKIPATALSGPLSELVLGRELSRRVSHSADANEFYTIICRSIRRLLDSMCVKIWSYNAMIEPSGELCLLGIDAPEFILDGCKTILSSENSLVAEVLSAPAIRQYCLSDPAVAELFSDTKWLAQIREKANWVVIIPVFNTSNTHQLPYFISSYSKSPILMPAEGRGFGLDANLSRLGQLEAIGWIVAHWADYLTDEICSSATGHTNHLCTDPASKVDEFIETLTSYLRETFDCNQVTIFLEDITRKRLQPVGKSAAKLNWPGDEHYYSISDDRTLTWQAWKGREMVFSSSAHHGKGREKRPPEDANRDEILFAPLVRRNGYCHGVVRLHNKRRRSGSVSSMFTDDDAAKLDAIIQTALPRLELLQAQERQLESLSRMVHELQVPLVAIRGAINLMLGDLERAEIDPKAVFRRDFPADVMQWATMMGRLTRTARIFASGGLQADTLRLRKTSLLAEVVMPVIRQIQPMVPEGVVFDCHQEHLHTIPSLFLDRDQFQQVFFNLLSNSIKYGSTTNRIRITISGGPMGSGFAVFVQDWGNGIAEDDKEKVFDPGFRGERAALENVSGQGIGLFVVRSIVQGHGGTIHVRSCRYPTTFEIFLPSGLLRNRSSSIPFDDLET